MGICRGAGVGAGTGTHFKAATLADGSGTNDHTPRHAPEMIVANLGCLRGGVPAEGI